MSLSTTEPLNLTPFQIVHQNSRRIRFSIPQLATDPNYTVRLQKAVSAVPGVDQARINASARSLVVEYDPILRAGEMVRVQTIEAIQQASVPSEAHLSGTSKLQPVEPLEPLLHIVGYDVLHFNSWRTRIRIPCLSVDPSVDESYANKLRYHVQQLEGVQAVRINRVAAALVVEYRTLAQPDEVVIRQHQLIEAIQQAAFLDTEWIEAEDPKATIDYQERLGLPAIALLLGLGALIELPLPGLLVSSIVFTAAMPVFRRAWDSLKHDRELTIDFLDGLAISLHTLQGTFFGATLMLGLIEGGEVIRDLTARSSERASLDLLDCLGTSAYVERDGREIQIPVKDIVPGDRVVVYPGDQIPTDGLILRGTALIDQCKLTGESVPVIRTEQDEVFASTLIVEGQLCILAERTGNSTRAGVIVNLMQSAPIHDTRVENYAASVANQLVVPTLLTATLVGLTSGDLNRAISLLTLDLGTGIRISVPTTILSALTDAARNGIFIRSGRAIEVLAKVDTIVFDKTGTLTQGYAGITGVQLTQPGCERNVLRLAATAEQGLTHPVAEAIVRHAKLQGIAFGNCDEWEYCVGLGVVARIEGQSVLVGSHRLMAREEIWFDEIDRGDSLIYVAIDGKLAGVILYRDPLRPESHQVMRSLHHQGVETYMLSGDVSHVAKSVAAELEMNPDRVYAEAFPERKVEVVKALHDRGKTVAFCGDGINDSAALAYADVSISFAGATDIARETADIVLMENDLRSLLQAIQIAKQAMSIIEQNIALVAIPNIGAVVAGVCFALDPVLAILINNGSAILAELNGLRPLLGTPAGTSETRSLNLAVDAPKLPFVTRQELTTQNASTQNASTQNASAQNASTQNAFTAPLNSDTEQIRSDDLEKRLPLKQCDLAKRIGVSPQTLSRRKLDAEFGEWSRDRDPDCIAWSYQADCKLFLPL